MLGASPSAVLSASGGIAAKFVGLGVAKAAVVALAATSVVAYGGVQASRVVPPAPPAAAPQVAAAAAPTPSPAPSTDLAVSSTVAEQQSAAAAAAADMRGVESQRRQLRLLRRAAVLTGDPQLAAQVRQLGLLLAGGGLAGADALREWNDAKRTAMRMLRAIGGRGPGDQGHTDTLVALVRGAQARVRLAAAQNDSAGGAAPEHTVAVTRPAAPAASGAPASRAGSSSASSNEPAPSAVDPSNELGGIRDATPDKGGSAPAGDLPSKPKKPVTPTDSQGGTLVP